MNKQINKYIKIIFTSLQLSQCDLWAILNGMNGLGPRAKAKEPRSSSRWSPSKDIRQTDPQTVSKTMRRSECNGIQNRHKQTYVSPEMHNCSVSEWTKFWIGRLRASPVPTFLETKLRYLLLVSVVTAEGGNAAEFQTSRPRRHLSRPSAETGTLDPPCCNRWGFIFDFPGP